MGIVDLYQWSLEMNAFNVYDTSVKSQLELLENVGLQGTLSKQALFLVCMDSRVESIVPDYPMIPELTEGSGDVIEEDTVDCSKLILTEPYTGEDYSIVLKPRTSTTDLYNIISRVEIEKMNDEAVSFRYHYAARRGTSLKLIVTMNIKALELACKEPEVEAIIPNYDTSVINKREVTTTTEQDFSPHCSLPEVTEEYPTFIFGYNVEDATELYTIREAVEGYTDNSADVQSAIVAEFLNMIIFKMNRAAYLKACTNPAVTFVEYDQETTTASTTQPPTTTTTTAPTTVPPTVVEDACQDVTAIKEHQIYSIQILSPESLADKQTRCEKMKRQLERRTKKIEGFWALTSDQSCETCGDAVTLHARLNELSLIFMCEKNGLNIPVPPEPEITLGPAISVVSF
ncbi:uncharacterized protein [Dysidea avara]